MFHKNDHSGTMWYNQIIRWYRFTYTNFNESIQFEMDSAPRETPATHLAWTGGNNLSQNEFDNGKKKHHCQNEIVCVLP